MTTGLATKRLLLMTGDARADVHFGSNGVAAASVFGEGDVRAGNLAVAGHAIIGRMAGGASTGFNGGILPMIELDKCDRMTGWPHDLVTLVANISIRSRNNGVAARTTGRIALGSGTTIQEVNRLIKQFQTMQKMMKQMSRAKPGRMKLRMPF